MLDLSCRHSCSMLSILEVEESIFSSSWRKRCSTSGDWFIVDNDGLDGIETDAYEEELAFVVVFELVLKDETEGDGDDLLATLIILLRAYVVCSWISRGMDLGLKNPLVELTTFCGRRESNLDSQKPWEPHGQGCIVE